MNSIDFNNPDIQALALTRAIALTESGDGGKPNYNASGKSGEKGAYQWMPGNFEASAKAAGLDPNDFSPENQDKVAYSVVKRYKDQGYDPGQISSLWNSGSPDNWQSHSGVNKLGVAYDTPAYVNKVKQNYQKLSQPNIPSQQVSQTTSSQGYQQPSLGTELAGRLSDLGTGLESVVGGKKGSGQSRFSGAIQSVGAVAGALGDVVNKGLELIPGVKQIENLIGGGAQKLAQTPVGQSILQSVQKFGQDHPELSKDIGAGFNILTAIPILRGIGVAGDAILDGTSSILKNQAEKTFTNEAGSIIGRTAAGDKFLQRTPNAIQDMIKERILPDVSGGKYEVKGALADSQNLIKSLNNQVKNIFNNYTDTRIADEGQTAVNNVINGYTNRFGTAIQGFPKANLTPQEIIDIAKSIDRSNATDWDKLLTGDLSLKDMNSLRSSLDDELGTYWTSTAVPSFNRQVAGTLSSAIRDTLQQTVPETQALFKRMSSLYDVQKALEYMRAKSVKPGAVAGFIEQATSKIPVANLAGKYAARKSAQITTGILNRTASNAARVSRSDLLKKLPGLFAGAANVSPSNR